MFAGQCQWGILANGMGLNCPRVKSHPSSAHRQRVTIESRQLESGEILGDTSHLGPPEPRSQQPLPSFRPSNTSDGSDTAAQSLTHRDVECQLVECRSKVNVLKSVAELSDICWCSGRAPPTSAPSNNLVFQYGGAGPGNDGVTRGVPNGWMGHPSDVSLR